MSDIYVGLKAQNIDIGAEMPGITGVRLLVDSDHEYVVGDAVGRMMEVECPWGTEDMAKSILATMSGVQYRPYTAERAMLDPAFEPGDAVIVGGVSSVIVNSDINYNGAALANIDAPALDEIDDEYPAQQTQNSSFERQIAYTRSLITKTADQIRLEVQGVEDQLSAVDISLGEITLAVAGLDGAVSTIGQTVNNITLSVTDEDGNVSIQLKAGDKELGTPGTIDLTGVVTFSALAGEPTGATKINGGWIDTETLTVKTAVASKLKGGFVQLLGDDNVAYGSLNISDEELIISADYNIGLTDGSVALWVGGVGAILEGNFWPTDASSYDIGSGRKPWATLYADTCECCTSDRNRKNSIEDLPNKYINMFNALTPRRFKLNAGASDRYHVGFISQEVEEAMREVGITSQEFGGFIKDKDEDGIETYMLRYSEFIAILVAKVQAMQKEIDVLKARG